jgi:murein DD-endopeptidase MepM/ murein hydrolase activator NlpD
MLYHLKQKFVKAQAITAGLLMFGLLFGFYPNVAGQTADELAQMKQEKQQQLDSINKKISDLQTQIKQRQSVANSLKNELAIIDLQVQETEAKIEQTNAEIDATNLDIAETTNQIVKAQDDIAKQKSVLKELIAQINDLDQMSPLEIALENDNFTEFLDQIQYASDIQERSQDALDQIKVLKATLEEKNLSLKKEKSDLDTLSQQLVQTQDGLAVQKASKNTLLAQTKGQEKLYQGLLSDQEDAEAALQNEINDLDAKISEQLGDRKQPPHKGLFLWPLEGVLTQGYGNTGFTSLGYNFHNGLDIAAAAGTKIVAAYDGIVQDTGMGEGAYGNWVTIRHDVGGGRQLITLYGHMASFVVAKGQAVKMGDLVGFEGNTGNTTRLLYGPHRGFHLHFTVFDAEGYGVSKGTLVKQFGNYMVPYGATYNPLDFL